MSDNDGCDEELSSDINHAWSLQERLERQPQLIEDWAGAKNWRLWEAVALWCDEDPKASIRSTGLGSVLDVEAPEGHHLLDLACREFDTDQIAARIDPERFMSWAESIGRPFSADWIEAVRPHAERRAKDSVDWKSEYDRLKAQLQANGAGRTKTTRAKTGALGALERQTLHKLIYELAVGGYGWAPTDARSSIPGEIEDALIKRGLSLSVDTIRNHLRASHETALEEADIVSDDL